jgi:hypothetical protein
VELYPLFDIDAENYEFWDKVGQIVGNLTELETINFHFPPSKRGMKTPALIGRSSLESCGIYGVRLRFVVRITRQRLKKSKV